MFPAEFTPRFEVPPGLTGLWQVSGRSALGTLDMLRLDVRYVEAAPCGRMPHPAPHRAGTARQRGALTSTAPGSALVMLSARPVSGSLSRSALRTLSSSTSSSRVSCRHATAVSSYSAAVSGPLCRSSTGSFLAVLIEREIRNRLGLVPRVRPPPTRVDSPRRRPAHPAPHRRRGGGQGPARRGGRSGRVRAQHPTTAPQRLTFPIARALRGRRAQARSGVAGRMPGRAAVLAAHPATSRSARRPGQGVAAKTTAWSRSTDIRSCWTRSMRLSARSIEPSSASKCTLPRWPARLRRRSLASAWPRIRPGPSPARAARPAGHLPGYRRRR